MRGQLFTGGRAALGVLLLWLAAGQAQADQGVYQRTLRSTGWVVIPQGKDSFRIGTCWVVDRERKLVVTNQHVVSTAREVSVYFPAWRKGKVVYESSYYMTSAKSIRGKVIATDRTRDLALVRLVSLPSWAPALPLAPRRPAPDEAVHSIGNSSAGKDLNTGRLWKYTRGKAVRACFGKVQTDKGPYEACWLEIRAAVNRGDSGGPLVNGRGQLVGVIANTDKEKTRALAVDLEDVKDFLAQNHVRKLTSRPASPVFGTWKMTFAKDGKEVAVSISCRADGGFELIGGKTIVGRYTYDEGRLALTANDGSLNDAGPVTWAGPGQFRVTFGKDEFVFRRR
jgi:S1-C subfamily serine protease